MLNDKIKNLPGSRPIILYNITCVYCGAALSVLNNTKEHVIARRFVPKGKLDKDWNLIVCACRACNGRKSDLEDDISAITMNPNAWGMHAAEDESLAFESERKSRSCISRLTGKHVHKSQEQFEVKVPFSPGVELTFTLTSPPQISSERIFELARLQLMAFFYWITYDIGNRTGGFWLGSFFPILDAARTDWGNPIHKHFMQVVVDWEPRVLGICADGFFKVVIRRHPEAVCWSWALEWNKQYRVIGFFGEQEPAQAIFDMLPSLSTMTIEDGPNRWLRYRTEIPLDDVDDCLFTWNNTEDLET